MRGLYSTKDTFVTRALQAGVKIGWLEDETGVNYATLRMSRKRSNSRE